MYFWGDFRIYLMYYVGKWINLFGIFDIKFNEFEGI